MTSVDAKLQPVEAAPTDSVYRDDQDDGGYNAGHDGENTGIGEENDLAASLSLGAHAFEPGEIDQDHYDDEFRIEDDRFTRAKPVWNDVKFAFFFGAVFLAFVVTSMVMIIKHIEEFVSESAMQSTLPNSAFFEFKTILLILFISMISFGVSLLIFLLAGKNSAKFTSVGLKVVVFFLAISGVAGFFVGQHVQAVVFVAIAVASVVILVKYSPLVSLASTILNVVITVMKRYPSTAVAALIGFLSSAFFISILTLAIGCTYIAFGFNSDGSVRFDDDGNPTSVVTAKLVITILFLNFSGLYIADVLRNVMHVTIGGIYGTWYYLESTFEGMPTGEGTGSLKRALTYSFGSVCFGSLFVVLFQCVAIFFMINSNSLFGYVGHLSMNLLGMGVGYFNLYAYSFVALYGVSMVRSARSTYLFFRQRGLQAFLNDFVISASLGFYCVLASIFGTIITYIYLVVFRRLLGLTDDAFFPLVSYSFILTFNITSVLITTIVSGSSVFFFALNKDPAVFQESHPFEFQEISRCYPKVLSKLQLND